MREKIENDIYTRLHRYVRETLLHYGKRNNVNKGNAVKLNKMNAAQKERLIKSIARNLSNNKQTVNLLDFRVEHNVNSYDTFEYCESLYSRDEKIIRALHKHFNDFMFEKYLSNFKIWKTYDYLKDERIGFMYIDENNVLEYLFIDNYFDKIEEAISNVDEF